MLSGFIHEIIWYKYIWYKYTKWKNRTLYWVFGRLTEYMYVYIYTDREIFDVETCEAFQTSVDIPWNAKFWPELVLVL